MSEAGFIGSSPEGEDFKFGTIARFCFGRRHVSDRFEQWSVVEPFDPFQGGELDGFERVPRSSSADHFGLVEAVDGFG